MANLNTPAEWVNGIYQIEETDPVQGGPGGIDNLQAEQLGKRTSWLKQELENLDQELSPAVAALRGVGRIDFFPGSTAPEGYLKANGATLSRSAYPELWAFAQSRLAPGNDTFTYPGLFGSGDGSTTFKIPDLRGYFPRFWAEGNSIDTDSSRAAGSKQDDRVGYHQHAVDASKLTFLSGSQGLTDTLEENASGTPGWRLSTVAKTSVSSDSADGGWGETRVKNIALLGCIKY